MANTYVVQEGSFSAATGGLQAAFGRLYQWMQFNKSNQNRGPIMDVVRVALLGGQSQRIIAKSLGCSIRTVERAKHELVDAGFYRVGQS